MPKRLMRINGWLESGLPETSFVLSILNRIFALSLTHLNWMVVLNRIIGANSASDA
jgi:hypothetical protein